MLENLKMFIFSSSWDEISGLQLRDADVFLDVPAAS